MEASLIELVEAADFNGLLAAVDRLCATREWEHLLDLRATCEAAVERGKQLWPIAEHIDYRIALEAPPSYAGDVLERPGGRFILGPLTEVAASTHTWDELAPHIDVPQMAAYVAQERVLRGEVLTGDPRAHQEVLELPLELQEWEPTYALAMFKSNYVEVGEPWTPKEPLSQIGRRTAPEIDEVDKVDALLDLVQPWTTESNGAARAIAVKGDAVAAASELSFSRLRVGPLSVQEALHRMAWAAASGGAHGRRRGAAFGRFLTHYAGATLAGLEWPAEPTDLGAALARLEWFYWDEAEPETGWVLRVAVEDPSSGWSVAIGASDVLEEETE
ncbi:MAG: hypothetical protein M3280_03800 [Actinomycetota bacterium]|nr:hypothetical protein [Actinomycetota bacterium]